MKSTKSTYVGFEELWEEVNKKLDFEYSRYWLCRIYGALTVWGDEKMLKISRRAFEKELANQEKEKKDTSPLAEALRGINKKIEKEKKENKK